MSSQDTVKLSTMAHTTILVLVRLFTFHADQNNQQTEKWKHSSGCHHKRRQNYLDKHMTILVLARLVAYHATVFECWVGLTIW